MLENEMPDVKEPEDDIINDAQQPVDNPTGDTPEKEVGNFEKIVMAGIDAITKTAESAGEMLDDLVKKGSLSMDQGKAINEELKHGIKTTVKEKVDETAQSIQSKAVNHFIDKMDKLSPEDLQRIRDKITELENTKGDQ